MVYQLGHRRQEFISCFFWSVWSWGLRAPEKPKETAYRHDEHPGENEGAPLVHGENSAGNRADDEGDQMVCEFDEVPKHPESKEANENSCYRQHVLLFASFIVVMATVSRLLSLQTRKPWVWVFSIMGFC